MKECNVQISALVAAQGDLSQKLADLSLQADALFGKAKEETKELLKKREIVQVGSPNPELTDADAYHVPVRTLHLSPCKFYYSKRYTLLLI